MNDSLIDQYIRTQKLFGVAAVKVDTDLVGAMMGMADAWCELWLIEEELMWLGRS